MLTRIYLAMSHEECGDCHDLLLGGAVPIRTNSVNLQYLLAFN
jgi:hypothetical protein